MNPEWTKLFPDADYDFRFGMRPGPPEGFFGATDSNQELLAERVHWLAESADRYAVEQSGFNPLLEESVSLLKEWRCLPADAYITSCESLGRILEPDIVLLATEPSGPRLLGGCVCFPSSWRLGDKLGMGIESIHTPVPGLNTSLGDRISRFLTRMKPGVAWFRSNWGMSRVPDLNQHLDRDLPRLQPEVEEDELFLRIENQALVALPESNGILFGIRLEVIPFPIVMNYPDAAHGLKRALESMPDDVAEYKGLAESRPGIIRLLTR